MIDSNTENVKLTFDQLQQIDTVQKQLSNLQSEITNHVKILRGTQMESDRAVKEKAYQEELLAGLQQTVETLTAQKDALVKDISDAGDELNKTNESIAKLNQSAKETTDLLNKREEAVKKSEENLNRKVEDFNTQASRLLEDQLSIKTAKDAFLKASETVIW